MKRKLTLTPADAGMRIDQYLAREMAEQSRSFLQKLIKSGKVVLNNEVVASSKSPLPVNGVIYVDLPEITVSDTPEAEEFTFELLYEDNFMAVINKPPGVVVHPAPGNPDGTVVNAILSRYPELRSAELPDGSRPGIVHRLDKDTSGCLVVARTAASQAKLCAAFAERQTAKTYLALTVNAPKSPRGRIENLIGRHPVNRQKMAIVKNNGKIAVSEYEVLGSAIINTLKVSLIKVRIYTGRTHQIRVHLASLNCPVLGDELYGGVRSACPVPRQMLHAWKLQIPHPVSGEILKMQAPLPEDFKSMYESLLQAQQLQ